MIFFVLSGEMTFLSPENMILFFRQKIKDDLSQKIHGKMIFSSNVLKKWSFQKKLHWNMIFLVLSRKMVFFLPGNMIFFLWTENGRYLSQETHGNMIFSVYMCKCYKYDITLRPKKSKTIFSRQNALKGDWHSRLTF